MTDYRKELQQLLKIAEQALVDEDKDYFVSYVVERVENAYDATKDPGLQVLRNAIAARADDMIISRAEIKDIWADTQNSTVNVEQARELLGDLIGEQGLLVASPRDSSFNMGGDALDISVPDAAKYAAAFGINTPNKILHKTANAIESELSDEGLDADLELAVSDSRFAVFAAHINSGARSSNILIPVELTNGMACLPSVFYGNGFAEFNGENLRRWASFGGSADITAVGLLDRLNHLAGPIRVASSDEMWDISIDGGSGLDVGQSVSPVIENYEVSSVLSPEAMAAGGEDFEKLFREAVLSCGPEKLAMARSMLKTQLGFARVAHDSIVVESEFEGGIRFGTHIKSAANKQYVVVPVEFGAHGPLIPEIFQVGNRSMEFTTDNLRSIATSDEAEFNAYASDLGTRSYSDLYRIVIKSAQNSDIVSAEEAMSVILQNFGEELHRQAFQDMMGLLQKSSSMQRDEFDVYADKLSEEGSDIANYASQKSNAAMFGLLD